jgi:hypothetical protein
MAPPVARCLCEGASVSGVGFWRACLRCVSRGFERIASPTSTAMRMLPSPRAKREMELAWPR